MNPTLLNYIKIINVYDMYEKRECCFVWQKITGNSLSSQLQIQEHDNNNNNIWDCVGMGAECFKYHSHYGIRDSTSMVVSKKMIMMIMVV
jgi:hypothetical protein